MDNINNDQQTPVLNTPTLQPVQSPPPAQPDPPTHLQGSAPEPKKKPLLIWLFILSLILVLGLGGYFVYHYLKAKNNSKSQNNIENAEVNNNANAKIYEDSSSYLSFQYSSDWGVLSFDQGKTIYLTPKLNEFLEQEKAGGGEDLVRIHIKQNDLIIKLSLIDVKYTDSKYIVKNFCETEIIEDLSSGLKAEIKTENKKVNDKTYKYISYNTPIPDEIKPYLEEMREKAKSTGAPENVYMGEYDYHYFPQYRAYYTNLDKYQLIVTLISLDANKYENILQSVLSNVKINNVNVELKSYDQFGLNFKYPTLWKLDEEWTGRNDNLGEVDLWPNLTKYESANDKSIRISIRKVGKSEGTAQGHIINPQWSSTDIIVDGHNGRRYTYIGTRMYQGETTQEHVLFKINDKYEVDIYNEDAEVHKYLLDELISGLKIDVNKLSAKADEVVASGQYK